MAFDTRDLRLICELRGFLCRFCCYSGSRHANYLLQSAFIVQILGVILGLICGTSECTRMLQWLVRNIYVILANYVTDLRSLLSAIEFGHAEQLA